MANPYNNENEPRPGSWPSPPAGYEVVDDGEGADQPGPLQYAARLWRHRWLIAAILIPCLAASVYLARLAGPTFVATARLRLGAQMPKVAPFQPAEDRTDARVENLVQTQVNIFQNRTIAGQAVDQLGYKPEPSRKAELKTRVLSKIYGPDRTQKIVDRQTAREQAIDAFMEGLSVVPIAETQIFEARYSSQDPDFSARALNALCEAYLRNDFQTKSASYSEARRWLQEKMTEVKGSLARSEEALYKFTGADGSQFMTLSDGGLQYLKEMDELRLKISGLEDEFTKHKADRDRLAAGGLPDDTLGGGASVASQLRTQLAAADIELEKVKQTLGPMDSSYKNATAARERLAAQFNTEKSRLLQVANLQYKQTQERLAQLKKNYDERQQHIIGLQQRLSGYNTLKRDVDLNRETYNSLQQKWQEIGIGQSIQPADAVILQRAERPLTAIYSKRNRILLYGLLIGLCLSFGAAIVADRLDTSIKTSDEIWRLSRLETLGALPAISGGKSHPGLVMHEKPGSAAADNIRALRGSVEFVCGGHPPKTLLVTSAARGDGKTTVAANIAISLAQKGRSVLLIDADLKDGALHRAFELNGGSGLAELLASGRAWIDEFVASTSIPRLCVIPGGNPSANPSDLLDGEAMQHVLGAAAAHFDHVVIDSISLHTLADAGALARHADAVVVVARPNRTPREAFLELHRLLSVAGARVIGVVLNNAQPEPIRIHDIHAPGHLDRVLHDGNGQRRKGERLAAAGSVSEYYDI